VCNIEGIIDLPAQGRAFVQELRQFGGLHEPRVLNLNPGAVSPLKESGGHGGPAGGYNRANGPRAGRTPVRFGLER
jgi:hypothetical protein